MKKSEVRQMIREIIKEARIEQNYDVGDTVTLTSDAIDNYGKKYRNKKFEIESVATSKRDHPGFDDSAGQALYDLVGFNNSVYVWEIE